MFPLQKLKVKEAKLLNNLMKKEKSSSNTSLNSVKSDDSRLFEDSINQTGSDLDISRAGTDTVDNVYEPSSPVETMTVRISPDKIIKIPSLTTAQVKAITGC